MHEKLKVEHAKFEREHADALERCSLYDRDMLEKSGRIKNHEIELSTLEKLIDLVLLHLTEPKRGTAPQFLLLFREKYLDLLQQICQIKHKLCESPGSYSDIYKHNVLVSIIYSTLLKLVSNLTEAVFQEIFLILSSLKSCAIAL